MARELREIVTKLLQTKFSNDEGKMARWFEIDRMDVRRLTGKEGTSGRNQQKLFEFILRVLPLCKELGIDPYEGSTESVKMTGHLSNGKKSLTPKGIVNDAIANDSRTGGASAAPKAIIKKASVSPIQKGRNTQE